MSRTFQTRRHGSGITTNMKTKHTAILTLLLVLAAASWASLIWQSRTAQGMGGGLTMGMGAVLFLAIRVVMMVAMMFPPLPPRSWQLRGSSAARVPSDPPLRSTWVFSLANLHTRTCSAPGNILASKLLALPISPSICI